MSAEIERRRAAALEHSAAWFAAEQRRYTAADIELEDRHEARVGALVVGVLALAGFTLLTVLILAAGLLVAGIAVGAAAVVAGAYCRAMVDRRKAGR